MLLNKHDAQCHRTLFRDRLGLTLEPLLCQLIRVEVMVCLIPHLGMVVVDPLKLGIAQQGWLDQVAANRCHSNMLEAQPLLVAKFVSSINLACQDNI